MSSKNTAVFGIYKSAEHAERAVESLIAVGYPSTAISVLLPDNRSTKEFAHEKDTKAPEGAAAGARRHAAVGSLRYVGANFSRQGASQRNRRDGYCIHFGSGRHQDGNSRRLVQRVETCRRPIRLGPPCFTIF